MGEFFGGGSLLVVGYHRVEAVDLSHGLIGRVFDVGEVVAPDGLINCGFDVIGAVGGSNEHNEQGETVFKDLPIGVFDVNGSSLCDAADYGLAGAGRTMLD